MDCLLSATAAHIGFLGSEMLSLLFESLFNQRSRFPFFASSKQRGKLQHLVSKDLTSLVIEFDLFFLIS
jgi:hypothetical protein